MRKVMVGRVGESNEGKMGITTTKKKRKKNHKLKPRVRQSF